MQQQLMHQMQQQQQFNTTSVTTDHIQQYLDENKALILNILENQNTGKFSECAENQTRLQQNLMYLAAIADCQPKPSPILLQQQQLQSHNMVPQSQMMAQSHTAFGQHPPFTVMQQHHHHALQSQLGIGSSGTSGVHTPRSGTSMEGVGFGAFPDFSPSIYAGEGSQGLSRSANRPKETRSSGSAEENPQKKGRKANSTEQRLDVS